MLNDLKNYLAVSELSTEQVVDEIFGNKSIKRIYFLSPVTYQCLRKGKVAISPDVLFVDSIALVRLLNFVWRKKFHRYSFDTASLAPVIYKRANATRAKLAIIGAKEDESLAYCQALSREYPDIDIVYRQHGYFSVEQRSEVLKEVEKANADIIVVGLGAPAQEIFCNSLDVKPGQKIFTCGGHITQSATSWNFYPKIIEATHLRWLYRLIKEPHTRKRFPSVFTGLIYAWNDIEFAREVPDVVRIRRS